MKEIRIKVNGIWLEPIWAVAGTRGSFGSCKLSFEFSPEWNGMQKRVTFFPADGTDAVALLMQNDEVIVPCEVMAHAGSAGFVIDGVGEGGEVTLTQKGELRVVDTAEPGGKEPSERTPGMLEQLRAEIAYLRGEMEKLKGQRDGIKIF